MAHSASLSWAARLPGPIHPAAVAAAVLLHLVALGALLRAGHVVSPPPPVVTLALAMPQAQSVPAQSASPSPPAASPPPQPVQTTPAPSALTPLISPDRAAPEEAPARAGQVPPPPVQAAQAPRERTTTSHPLPPREAARREAPSPAPPAPPASPTAAPPAASAASAAAASWQAALSAWLQAHKFYPERARRRGEQGTVVLRFTAERDGRVLHVALVEPSGSRILDNAALSMLRDAHIPPFPATMPQQQITLTLPVRYALQP